MPKKKLCDFIAQARDRYICKRIKLNTELCPKLPMQTLQIISAYFLSSLWSANIIPKQ